MKKNVIVIAFILMFILSIIVGFFMGLSIPINNLRISGNRSSLLGSWIGSNTSTSFSLRFYENGSLLFSAYRGNFTINQDHLTCHNHGITLTADFSFMNDDNTLVLTNINCSSPSAFGFFGVPYGIILQRA